MASLPRPLRAAATARPGQPSLHHLAVCPHGVLEGRETKREPNTSTYRHTHMHTRWQRVTVALVYPALPRSPFILSLQSVMLCVTSHKCQCHHGTVINFGVLGKMSSRCLFGLSFSHPLAHPRSPRVLESWVESGKHPLPSLHAPRLPVFWEVGVANHHRETKAT